MTLPADTLARLRARIEAEGLRATARALELPTMTVRRASLGGAVTAGTAMALRAALAGAGAAA